MPKLHPFAECMICLFALAESTLILLFFAYLCEETGLVDWLKEKLRR